jgi:hypothetical protein
MERERSVMESSTPDEITGNISEEGFQEKPVGTLGMKSAQTSPEEAVQESAHDVVTSSKVMAANSHPE